MCSRVAKASSFETHYIRAKSSISVAKTCPILTISQLLFIAYTYETTKK